MATEDTSLLNPDRNAGGEETSKASYSFLAGAKEVCIKGPLNILFVCVPFAIISHFLYWPEGVTFVLSVLSLVPLAERLGFCTEQLALHSNDSIGGLLNATFGNATELIVAIAALNKHMYRLVQLSLLGSITSNLLLVLGTSFFAGGIKYHTQHFSKISSRVNSVLLMLAAMCLIFPSALDLSGEMTETGTLGSSRACSLFLFVLYGVFIYYQLFTHRSSYEETEHYSAKKDGLGEENVSTGGAAAAAAAGRGDENAGGEGEEEDDEEQDVLGMYYGCFWLAVLTIFISLVSDALADTIEEAGDDLRMSSVFLAAVILPIVGNAAEHAGAVTFALKNKMDLTLGVAVGSSTQIGLFVLPLLVIIGWCANLPMSLNLGAFEAACLFLTVVIVTFALKDGVSDWLVGVCLILAYCFVSVGFWVDTSKSLK